MLLVWVLATLLLCSRGVAGADDFRESLLLRPLVDGRMLVHFSFTTTTTTTAPVSSTTTGVQHMSHFDLLPMSFALVAHQHGVQHLKVSMTAGRWRAERWGVSPAPAPSGLLAHASFVSPEGDAGVDDVDDVDVDVVDTQWRGLMHALGGLLCASMSFVVKGDTHTLALGPRERYGTLPREVR